LAESSAGRRNPKEAKDEITTTSVSRGVMAGGGVKGGIVHGATDDIGLKAVQDPVHIRDLHTTVLHQLGLNQDALSHMHQGRRERLTEVHGSVIKNILA
jgi:hypothetical protein